MLQQKKGLHLKKKTIEQYKLRFILCLDTGSPPTAFLFWVVIGSWCP